MKTGEHLESFSEGGAGNRGTVNAAFSGENGTMDVEMKRAGDMDRNRSKSTVEDADTELNDGDFKCGYGRCTPNFLQKCHNAKCLVFVLCLCAITQGIVINGLIPVSITTLEKRFHLSSTESGIFASMYDIAVLLVLVPLSYFGGKGHKGRYLGLGVIIMGIGSFICAIPQFTTGPYDYGQSAPSDTCQPGLNSSNAQCPVISNDSGRTADTLRLYFYVLLLGQLFHGIGASPLYTLGITYIDENTSQRASPVYLGVYIGFSTVGPALGFIIGGLLLRVYGDIGKVDLNSVHITVDDPRWYGAWWIGFVMTAVFGIIFSLPMLSFARELPEAREHRSKDVDQTNRRTSTDAAFSGQAFKSNFHEIWTSFLKLLKNPTFTCLMIMQVAESFLLNGFAVFLPKLVENVFSLSSSTASMLTGAILVIFGFAGNIFGGYLIRRFKLLCKGIILLALAFQSGSFLFVFSLLINCPQKSFIGITEPYLEGKIFPEAQLIDQCNSQCRCDEYYQPVCNLHESVSYFSACFAGCHSSIGSDNNAKSWTNCQCVQQRFNFTEISDGLNTSAPYDAVQQGLCPSTCPLMPLFFFLFAIEVMTTFSSAMPIQQAELRCVPFNLRTMAVGLRWIFARLIGAIPGTIAFGAAIDTTCIFWEKKCDVRASCLRYNSRHMALWIMGFALVIKSIVITSLFLAWKFYRPPPTLVKDDDALPGAATLSVDRLSNKVTPVSSPNDSNKF